MSNMNNDVVRPLDISPNGTANREGFGFKNIDYFALSNIKDAAQRMISVSMAVENAGYICLSDAILHARNGGNLVLHWTDREDEAGREDSDGIIMEGSRRMWKIKILCDEYGNPPVPGDKIKWVFKRTCRDKRTGLKLNSRQIKEMQRMGLGDSLIQYHGAIIDEYECISVGYKDAVTMLRNHGVHYESKLPLSPMKEFTSWRKKNPKYVPTKEELSTLRRDEIGLVHVHNWRFMEVPPGYEDTLLPKIRRDDESNSDKGVIGKKNQ
jgi:hypothetical protein